MYALAQQNFKRWNDALQTREYENVAEIYSASELSFLPTVSPSFIRDSQSTKAYFMEFLKKLPEGTITADNVQGYGRDAYLHSGLYTFMVGPEGQRQAVEARFSYMWRKVAGEWKITHHHSSALPPRPGVPVTEKPKSDEIVDFDVELAKPAKTVAVKEPVVAVKAPAVAVRQPAVAPEPEPVLIRDPVPELVAAAQPAATTPPPRRRFVRVKLPVPQQPAEPVAAETKPAAEPKREKEFVGSFMLD